MKRNYHSGAFFIPKIWKAGIFAFLLFTFAFMPVEASHRYHTSLTRMDYNDKEKSVEITMQLFTHDLIPMLERQAKKKVDLETTPNIDKLILDYVSKNFVLIDRNNKQRDPIWVGKELEVDIALVHIEIPLAEGLQGAQLKNTIFFEGFPEQTNFVTARFDGKKSDLLFKAGDKYKEIFTESGKNKK